MSRDLRVLNFWFLAGWPFDPSTQSKAKTSREVEGEEREESNTKAAKKEAALMKRSRGKED